MTFGLSTRWNAFRHTSGEEMIEEILRLGLDRVELGYDLSRGLVPGTQAMIDRNAVTVDSVHVFCPVPTIAPFGHPELFTLADPDARSRDSAVKYIVQTLEFGAEMGARNAVLHAGNIRMRPYSRKLASLCEQGRQDTPRYEKLVAKALIAREKRAAKQLDHLYKGIEKLLPSLETTRMRLAIEVLPTWEAIPSELELETLLKHFGSPHLGYWHDMGHAQIRENLGLVHHTVWLKRLDPQLAGLHVHDVAAPTNDHIMPPSGDVDFTMFKRLGSLDIPAIFEPAPGIPSEDLKKGIEIVRNAWVQAENTEGKQ